MFSVNTFAQKSSSQGISEICMCLLGKSDFWNLVLYRNETKIHLFCWQWIWKKKEAINLSNTIPSVQCCCGNLKFWLWFSGTGHSFKIIRTMKKNVPWHVLCVYWKLWCIFSWMDIIINSRNHFSHD